MPRLDMRCPTTPRLNTRILGRSPTMVRARDRLLLERSQDDGGLLDADEVAPEALAEELRVAVSVREDVHEVVHDPSGEGEAPGVVDGEVQPGLFDAELRLGVVAVEQALPVRVIEIGEGGD